MHVLLLSLALIAGPVAFEQALELSGQAPALRALERAYERRARLAHEVSRVAYNPVLQLQPGYRDMATGGSGFEVYATVLQKLDVYGVGKGRKHAIGAELERDAALQAFTRRALRQEVAETWLRCWVAGAQLAFARQAEADASTWLAQLERARAAGEATRAEVGLARAFRAETGLIVLDAEGRTFEAGILLGRLLGLSGDEPVAVSEELPQWDGEDAPAAAPLSLRTPALRLAEANAEVDAKLLQELETQKKPGLALGGSVWREGTGDVAGVVTLEVEVAAFNRGERERAGLAAQSEQARADAERSVIEARHDRMWLVHELEHRRRVLALVEGELLTASEQVLEAQRARFEAREGTIEEWLRARRALFDVRMRALLAKTALAEVLFRLAEWRAYAAQEAP